MTTSRFGVLVSQLNVGVDFNLFVDELKTFSVTDLVELIGALITKKHQDNIEYKMKLLYPEIQQISADDLKKLSPEQSHAKINLLIEKIRQLVRISTNSETNLKDLKTKLSDALKSVKDLQLQNAILQREITHPNETNVTLMQRAQELGAIAEDWRRRQNEAANKNAELTRELARSKQINRRLQEANQQQAARITELEASHKATEAYKQKLKNLLRAQRTTIQTLEAARDAPLRDLVTVATSPEYGAFLSTTITDSLQLATSTVSETTTATVTEVLQPTTEIPSTAPESMTIGPVLVESKDEIPPPTSPELKRHRDTTASTVVMMNQLMGDGLPPRIESASSSASVENHQPEPASPVLKKAKTAQPNTRSKRPPSRFEMFVLVKEDEAAQRDISLNPFDKSNILTTSRRSNSKV